MTQVGIVADDLTGAFDAAAPFAARGMTTLVATAPDGLATDGDVVSLTTASRHLPAAEAQAAVKAGYAAMARLAPAVW
ncbi:MAG: four-carbon acid sugar kinase family protein, partial [Alphaproteobacteria bacterium]|nr:four-carbon acid sugar kinase family protein [Alphaproteobacteria bacterium]